MDNSTQFIPRSKADVFVDRLHDLCSLKMTIVEKDFGRWAIRFEEPETSFIWSCEVESEETPEDVASLAIEMHAEWVKYSKGQDYYYEHYVYLADGEEIF